MKILILAANPAQTGRLRIDEEVRKIEEGIKLSKYRDEIKIVAKWAVNVDDLRRALLEEKPAILHFTGHGAGNNPDEYVLNNSRDIEISESLSKTSGKGCLVIESDTGSNNFLNPDALAGLINLFKNDIKCIVLNACHSQYQAELFSEHVDYVIGMKRAVPDNTAIAFSVALYEAIANAESIPFAFGFAVKNISLKGLPGADIPELNIKKGLQTPYSLVKDNKAEVKTENKINAGEILEPFILQRLNALQKQMDMQLKLQDSYESKLLLEDDPQRQMKYQIEIEKLNTGVLKIKTEMNDLKAKSAGMQPNTQNDNQSLSDRIKNYVAQGKIEQAITETLKYLEKSENKGSVNGIILLSGRYNQIKSDYNKSLISGEEYRLEIARITNSFLVMITEVF